MKVTDVGYLTDNVAEQYSAEIYAATTISNLRRVLMTWAWCAQDALELSEAKDFNFPEWRDGLQKERKGEFAGEQWNGKYAAILMPARMFKASLIAEQFHVPWGCAWIRMQQEGI